MTHPRLCVLCGRDDHASHECPWPGRAFAAAILALLLASCGPQTSPELTLAPTCPPPLCLHP